MGERVIGSAPARICLGGESLDWMRNGPSVVAAINLKTTAAVESLPSVGTHHIIYAATKVPVDAELIRPWSAASWYTDANLKYVEAAIDTIKDKHALPQSLAVKIDSEIPPRAGVSSSAAVTLATVAATSTFFGMNQTTQELCEVAYGVERDTLKTGAGRMDFYACGMGGLLYLNCGEKPPFVEPHGIPPDIRVLLVNTRVPHETKSFISSKKLRYEAGDKNIHYYADQAEETVERLRTLISAFSDNQEEIGSLVAYGHHLLQTYIGCSTELLDVCVDTALKNGALGAKLTGSGLGGCMFALTNEENEERIASALAHLPVDIYPTRIIEEGVTIFNKSSHVEMHQPLPEIHSA